MASHEQKEQVTYRSLVKSDGFSQELGRLMLRMEKVEEASAWPVSA